VERRQGGCQTKGTGFQGDGGVEKVLIDGITGDKGGPEKNTLEFKTTEGKGITRAGCNV